MGLFGSRQNREEATPSPAPRNTEDASRREPNEAPSAGSSTKSDPAPPASQQPARERASNAVPDARAAQGGKSMANIGQSIVFKGELTGDEDLEIEGEVEGDVKLANHQLTIGANGRLKAEVQAKSVLVIGSVVGNLTATERIEIQASGVVDGDIKAPRLLIQEGAVLNGRIEMSSGGHAGAGSQTSKSSTDASSAASSSSSPSSRPPGESGKDAVRKTG